MILWLIEGSKECIYLKYKSFVAFLTLSSLSLLINIMCLCWIKVLIFKQQQKKSYIKLLNSSVYSHNLLSLMLFLLPFLEIYILCYMDQSSVNTVQQYLILDSTHTHKTFFFKVFWKTWGCVKSDSFHWVKYSTKHMDSCQRLFQFFFPPVKFFLSDYRCSNRTDIKDDNLQSSFWQPPG